MKTKVLSLALVFCTIFSSIVYASDLGNLSYWYANSEANNMIGKWSSSPSTYDGKLDNSFSDSDIYNFTQNAYTQWKNAKVPFPPAGEDDIINANFKVRFGTLASIQSVEPSFSSTSAGQAYSSGSLSGHYNYNGTSKDRMIISSSRIYVRNISGRTSDNYKKTTLEEIGHGGGWFGHTTASGTNAMSGSIGTTSTISTSDKNHISQVY